MKRADAGRLILLAAIWGASFMFMRIAAPVLGPVLTADLRMLVAGIALAAYFRAIGFDAQWRRWWREYAVVGLLNSGLPFLLYAYAAIHIPAGLLSVLNATAPMWGALLAAVFLGERLSARRALGLAIGVAGVALVTRPEAQLALALTAVAAALAAAFSYAVTGIVLKRWAQDVPARGMAVRTQLAAGVMLLWLAPLAPPLAAPPLAVAPSRPPLG